MATFDFAPMFRSPIGFDDLPGLLPIHSMNDRKRSSSP